MQNGFRTLRPGFASESSTGLLQASSLSVGASTRMAPDFACVAY
jgi:hypothetical protein